MNKLKATVIAIRIHVLGSVWYTMYTYVKTIDNILNKLYRRKVENPQNEWPVNGSLTTTTTTTPRCDVQS